MNIYMQVIELIANEDVDFAQIGRDLASQHPDIFMKLAEGGTFKDRLMKGIVKHHIGKIAAIKFVKDHFGWGLKECKEWVEALPVEFTPNPYSGRFAGYSEVKEFLDL